MLLSISPFEKNISRKDTQIDVDDLFKLHKLEFSVEISFGKAKKDDSKIRIKSKEELFRARYIWQNTGSTGGGT